MTQSIHTWLLLMAIGVGSVFTTESYAQKSTSNKIPTQGAFVLKGKATNVPKDQKVFRIAVCAPFDNITYDIPFNADGSFQKEMPLIGEQDLYLYLGNDAVTTFACPSDTLNLTFDYNNSLATMQLQGTTPMRNREIELNMELYRKFRKPFLDLSQIGYKNQAKGIVGADTTVINATRKYILDYQTTIKEFIAQHGDIPHENYLLQRGYFDALGFIAADSKALKALYYRQGVRCYPGEQQEKMPLYKDPSFNPFLSSQATSFMWGYIASNLNETTTLFLNNNNAERLMNQIKVAELTIPDKELFDWFFASNFQRGLRWFGWEPTAEIKEVGEYLAEKCTTPMASAILGKTLDQIFGKMSKGQPAPNFTLNDEKGRPVSLTDFKGKVVYIDFWSPGCGPCIQEFKKAEAFHKKYQAHKDKIAYLYICLDNDNVRWKKLIKEYRLEGINLRANSWTDERVAVYSTNAVPLFVLIDAEGKIVEFNTVRPSDLLNDRPNLLDATLKK
ncbi:MAG: TlpA disulfide reductase family protein [Tannerellaceae bacterium]